MWETQYGDFPVFSDVGRVLPTVTEVSFGSLIKVTTAALILKKYPTLRIEIGGWILENPFFGRRENNVYSIIGITIVMVFFHTIRKRLNIFLE